MPATDKYWRPIGRMHVIFAISCLVLLVVTLWMMGVDHDREWKPVQRTNENVAALRLQLDLYREGALSPDETAALASRLTEEQREKLGVESRPESESEYLARREALEKQIAEADAALEAKEDELDPLREKVRELKTRFDVLSVKQKGLKAELDKAAADRGLAIRDERPDGEIARLQRDFDEQRVDVDEATIAVEEAGVRLAAARKELAEAESRRTELDEELKLLRAEEDRLRTARGQLVPESTASWIKRKAMEWPILDGFNSHLRIRQDWLPDLHITLGMASTARFDRCRTCHLNAADVLADGGPAFPPAHGEVESDDYRDWVAENAYPQPYATHPRTDVYVTASSPHPVETFGCTICHQGNGSGTSFQDAEHGPDQPHEEHEWAEAYGHHPNHFWEYPMLPERFVESTCIKCHHDVVELGVHPEYGPTAPKVVEGFETIAEYGCFGCHEIHGYDGDERIGPDLRAEPNYAAAAAQILADDAYANRTELDEAGLGDVVRLVEAVLAQPMDSDEPRAELVALLEADEAAEEPRLSNRTHELAAALADEAHPGKFRRVGPALRHVAGKTTRGWLEFWTQEPSRFRPTTRMPQFWDLSNQLDAHAQELEPIEVASVVQYLLDKSQPAELLAPAEGYVPDVARGAEAFGRKGCLACHQIDMYAKGRAEFGPDLSRVYAKIKPGFVDEDGGFVVDSDGFKWLYTWILEPERHHPRTRMPNLYVNEAYPDPESEADTAADIAAFLLTNRYSVVLTAMPPAGDDFDEVLEIVGDEALGLDPDVQRDQILPYLTDLPKVLKVVADEESLEDFLGNLEDLEDLGAKLEVRRDDVAEKFSHESFLDVDEAVLDEMVEMLVRKTLTARQTEEFLSNREFPRPAERIKGDEIELAGPEPEDEAEWRLRKLNYVGRKTISKYGCYGCHDVPGFETARPIGTVLQDWGRKETSKLAVEHIAEYLRHHGEPDGGSTEERVETAIARARGGEYETEEEEAEALRSAYFYEDLLHHGRAGFLWQKLRQPRSYDHEKIETKGYDERLRMPRFPLDEEKIEAIATFVLGLVAEPPASQYVYTPDPRAADRIEGEFLLEKYNCVGCHYLEMPRFRVAVAPDGEGHFTSYDSVEAAAANPDADFYEHAFREMLEIRPVKRAYRGTTEDGRSIIEFHGQLDTAVLDPEADPSDIESNFLNFTTWENLDVGVKSGPEPETRLVTLDAPLIRVAPAAVLDRDEGHGGDFTLHLVEILLGTDPYTSDPRRANEKKLAWQSAPPPLVGEGHKVQTDWLYGFLRNPERLRRMTVLRMPRFNMSEAETRTLANYFAARDGAPYPYVNIEPREPEYLAASEQFLEEEIGEENVDYVQLSWQQLHNEQVQCYKCHQYGTVRFEAPLAFMKDTRGPDLVHANARLRPEWLKVWLSKPAWLVPYTGMPVNYPKPKMGEAPKIPTYGGRPDLQVIGVRDALLNYHRAYEEFGPIEVAPPTPDATDPMGNPVPADPNQPQPDAANPDAPNPDEANPDEANPDAARSDPPRSENVAPPEDANDTSDTNVASGGATPDAAPPPE